MKRTLITLLLLLATTLAAMAQKSVDELNAEIKRAEKEIAKNERLLKQVTESKKSNQTEIKLLQAKINNREKIVNNLGKQSTIIGSNITKHQRDISSMEKTLEALKEEYSAQLYEAYKMQLTGTPLLYLFSSKDLTTATRRYDFVQRYSTALRNKAGQIEQMTQKLASEIESLATQKKELEKTQKQHKTALGTLTSERAELRAAGKKLDANEKKISKELKAKREEKRKAQQTLQKIIDEETRRTKRKMTDAERRAITELSGRFDQNKGKMLLPADGGVIIEHFGKHKHPTQKHITIDNKGVNIAAPKGADVFAVFEGQVARVMYISGLNNCVMLRHGNYFTIYSNLASVCVEAGESVRTNQKIGNLSSSNNPDDHHLHFELWSGTTNQNPEPWFSK